MKSPYADKIVHNNRDPFFQAFHSRVLSDMIMAPPFRGLRFYVALARLHDLKWPVQCILQAAHVLTLLFSCQLRQ